MRRRQQHEDAEPGCGAAGSGSLEVNEIDNWLPFDQRVVQASTWMTPSSIGGELCHAILLFSFSY
jgi:hypothetical protein